MTDTFIHLVPIKDQLSGLFMMRFEWEGPLKTNPCDSFAAQTCYSVVNLTHEAHAVQFLLCWFFANSQIHAVSSL
jgi:hypothetical protein